MDLQELFQCIKGGKYRAFSVTNPGDLLVEPTLTLLNTNMCSSFIRENDHPNSDDHDWLHHFPQKHSPGWVVLDLVVSVRQQDLGRNGCFALRFAFSFSFASCESQGSTRVNWRPWNLVFSQKPVKGMFLLGSKNGRKQTMLSEEWIQI